MRCQSVRISFIDSVYVHMGFDSGFDLNSIYDKEIVVKVQMKVQCDLINCSSETKRKMG